MLRPFIRGHYEDWNAQYFPFLPRSDLKINGMFPKQSGIFLPYCRLLNRTWSEITQLKFQSTQWRGSAAAKGSLLYNYNVLHGTSILVWLASLLMRPILLLFCYSFPFFTSQWLNLKAWTPPTSNLCSSGIRCVGCSRVTWIKWWWNRIYSWWISGQRFWNYTKKVRYDHQRARQQKIVFF